MSPFPAIALLLLRLLFLFRIVTALLPRFRKPDMCEDVPLTPAQRAMLGLPPMSRPATPLEKEQYVTPPRYSRSGTPRSNSNSSLRAQTSGSPLSGRGTPFEPATSFFDVAGSPSSVLRSGSERRRLSYTVAESSPLSIKEFEVAGSVNTPTKSNKASVGLNNKWLRSVWGFPCGDLSMIWRSVSRRIFIDLMSVHEVDEKSGFRYTSFKVAVILMQYVPPNDIPVASSVRSWWQVLVVDSIHGQLPCRLATRDYDINHRAGVTTQASSNSETDATHAMSSITQPDERLYSAKKDSVPIETVRAANERAASSMPYEQVAVFMGGTGGIGTSTAYEFFRRTRKPKAYIVGRNAQRGQEVVNTLQNINPQGQAIMVQEDISLLRNVDTMCAMLKQREPKIHYLILTTGRMTINGRDETAEGLDKRMVVNYYARIRCILNLMPLLTAASEAKELSRVITVLGAGSEGETDFDDLDLQNHFTIHACLAHCVMMKDFMIEELAYRYPQTAFSHSFPGSIKTGIASNFSGPARLAVKVLYALFNPWLLGIKEAGERHFFQLTNACYPAADIVRNRRPAVPIPESIAVVPRANREVSSGGYLLDWDGSVTGDQAALAQYRALGGGAKVWTHTMDMFEKADQRLRQHDKQQTTLALEMDQRPVPNIPGWRPG
nr:oxidoreductase andh [Quercus suber]